VGFLQRWKIFYVKIEKHQVGRQATWRAQRYLHEGITLSLVKPDEWLKLEFQSRRNSVALNSGGATKINLSKASWLTMLH
jgi:hypothetical protein